MLSKAIELYEQGLYREAFNVAVEIAAQGPNVPARILMAKSVLNSQIDPIDDDAMDVVFQAVETAIDGASSIEDIWTIKNEISDAMAEWSSKVYQKHLLALESNPSEEMMRKTFQYPPAFAKNNLRLSYVTGTSVFVDQYLEENGLAYDAYLDMLDDRFGEHPTFMSAEQVSSMTIDTAKNLFSKSIAVCEDIAHTSAEYVQANLDNVHQLFFSAWFLAGYAADSENIPTELSLEGYHLKAEIIEHMLNVVLYPNGKAFYLFGGDRSYQVEQLRDAYKEISERDPSFQMPPLPATHINNSTNSGGCYVATAVYGSYDCPQVWTLRRFRDQTLAETWYGRAFIHTYYAISPALVKWFGHTKWFKRFWKGKLDRLVADLNADGFANTPYEDQNW